MTISKYNIEDNFVVLDANKNATIEINDSALYERLGNNYLGFKNCELISCHEFSQDWDTWEIHPNGDEVVILLHGQVKFVFEDNSEIELTEIGEYVIVPKNIWHTAKTDAKC